MILQTQRTNMFITLAFSILVAFLWAAPADAANCAKKPDHPQCTGGGDPPPEPTACADSQTFPTFVYWDSQGPYGRDLVVSDAGGGCKHVLTSYDNGGSIGGDSAFHYDESSGMGRVVWTDKLAGTLLFLTEFVVDSVTNEVSASPDPQVLAEGPWGSENGSIRDPYIAADGDTIGFLYRWPAGDLPLEDEGFTVFTASMSGCSSSTVIWDLLDPLGCSGSLSTVFSESSAENGGFYWNDLTINDDATRIYVNQMIHTQENTGNPMPGGTYVVDKIAGIWGDYSYVPELPFPLTVAVIDQGLGDGPRDVLAANGSSEINLCGEVIVVDIENCLSAAGMCDSIIGHNILGRRPSWLEDDRLVFEERIYKRQGKNYSCKTGGMGVADPFDSSTGQVHATDSGFEPLGWRRPPPPP